MLIVGITFRYLKLCDDRCVVTFIVHFKLLLKVWCIQNIIFIVWIIKSFGLFWQKYKIEGVKILVSFNVGTKYDLKCEVLRDYKYVSNSHIALQLTCMYKKCNVIRYIYYIIQGHSQCTYMQCKVMQHNIIQGQPNDV